jgi:hypothetical protein
MRDIGHCEAVTIIEIIQGALQVCLVHVASPSYTTNSLSLHDNTNTPVKYTIRIKVCFSHIL